MSIYRVKTLQIIKSNRGPTVRSTNPPPDPTGRIVLTAKSHGTSRKVDPGKRDIGSRDSAGRIPFIPPNRSRYIGARYTSAQISGPVTLGTGDLAGFPRASRATMRLANSFISIADWPGESIERGRFRRKKEEKKKLSARGATLRKSVNRNLLPLHDRFADTYNWHWHYALTQITHVISMAKVDMGMLLLQFISIQVAREENFWARDIHFARLAIITSY